MQPTVTFEDSLAVTVAGVRMELHHSPGETKDQIVVWLPDTKSVRTREKEGVDVGLTLLPLAIAVWLSRGASF